MVTREPNLAHDTNAIEVARRARRSEWVSKVVARWFLALGVLILAVGMVLERPQPFYRGFGGFFVLTSVADAFKLSWIWKCVLSFIGAGWCLYILIGSANID